MNYRTPTTDGADGLRPILPPDLRSYEPPIIGGEMSLTYLEDCLYKLYEEYPVGTVRPLAVQDRLDHLNDEYEAELDRLAREQMGFDLGVYESY